MNHNNILRKNSPEWLEAPYNRDFFKNKILFDIGQVKMRYMGAKRQSPDFKPVFISFIPQ
jgi:hypothetical protein